MSAPAWRKDGRGYDVQYLYEQDGRMIASVWRGGDRYYPWSVTMPGHHLGNMSTLASAKIEVERAHGDTGYYYGCPLDGELFTVRAEGEAHKRYHAGGSDR